VHHFQELKQDPSKRQIADDHDDGSRYAQAIEFLMRDEVGCGLSHVSRIDHLPANVQVSKEGTRGDNQVKGAREAGE
jgi:hypothetical protein